MGYVLKEDLSKKIMTPLHLHTDDSNENMVEVVNNYKQYIDKAVDMGLKAIAFTEHGNLLHWYSKKMYAENNGIKYIHAVETYMTMTLEEKVRDNYHITLIARNFEGVKELNKLVSDSSNRDDNHFYYNPRMSWEEIKNTSENIIVLTACLGGVLWQMVKKQDERFKKVFEWMVENKHRVFLEVQNHDHPEQVQYNEILKGLAKEHDMTLVGTGDFHALDEESDKVRKILQKSKRIQFTDEDAFKLHMKTYAEMFVEFMNQGIWTEEEVHAFLEQTNTIADMVEEFELDYSKKYPKLYEGDSSKILSQKISEGIKERGIDKLPHEKRVEYAKRIAHELKTYSVNEAEDYLLLEDLVKEYARQNDVPYGYSRGSVSGSLVAYIMRITDMDSVERGLNFERFMNTERISLADIDTDYSPRKRHMIQDFLMTHPKFYAYPIVTLNTIAMKGAIRDIGRGLEMPLDVVDEIAKGVEENEDYYRRNYTELFYYVDKVIGVVTSIGQHACGVVVSPIPVDENMGLIRTKDSKYPLTMLNMKEVDAQNYVKLDILGLDAIDTIYDTCELAGIEFLKPENMDIEDKDVWDSIKESNVNVFQWESDFSHQVYKDLFSEQTIRRIRDRNPDFSYMDLFSVGNAILRPSGASYRESVTNGEFYDNGHEALNKFLAPTLGRLVYQEQMIEFLVEFCGFSAGRADLIRRGIGKKLKQIIDEELPKIHDEFISTMMTKHGVATLEEAERIAEPFMQVFIDSADYGFSINHSDAYSHIGYANAYLKHYYPLEFCTASLNIIDKSKKEKLNKIVEFAKSKDIQLRGIRFGKSRGGYMMDKETNSIYQGIGSIKFMNDEIGEYMYRIGDVKFASFVDLLIFLKDNTVMLVEDETTGLNKIDILSTPENYVREGATSVSNRHLKILTTLNFFKSFGENGMLIDLLEAVDKRYKHSHKGKTKVARYQELIELEQYLRRKGDEPLPLVQQCLAELEYVGHIETVKPDFSPSHMLITEMKKNKTNVRAVGYHFASGQLREFKIGTVDFRHIDFKEHDVLQVIEAKVKPKKKKIEGRWQDSPTEKELWVKRGKRFRVK